jgi:hypothetical protein
LSALSLSGRFTVSVATRPATSSVRNLKGMEMYLLIDLRRPVNRKPGGAEAVSTAQIYAESLPPGDG